MGLTCDGKCDDDYLDSDVSDDELAETETNFSAPQALIFHAMIRMIFNVSSLFPLALDLLTSALAHTKACKSHFKTVIKLMHGSIRKSKQLSRKKCLI